jgi:molybdopterin-containing oxidoreductase family membrane subunit
MGWGYFFFNDYLVQWYGGDRWTDLLVEWVEKGPMAWMFYCLLAFCIVIPWAVLWRKKWRATPWILASVGLIINVGMYFERYLIIPVGLTINRMFTCSFIPGSNRLTMGRSPCSCCCT